MGSQEVHHNFIKFSVPDARTGRTVHVDWWRRYAFDD